MLLCQIVLYGFNSKFVFMERSINLLLLSSASCTYIYPCRSFISILFPFCFFFTPHTHNVHSHTHTYIHTLAVHHTSSLSAYPNSLSFYLCVFLSFSLAVSLYLSVSPFRCRCCWRTFCVCVCVYCTYNGIFL